jgi:acetyl esterase/lipase
MLRHLLVCSLVVGLTSCAVLHAEEKAEIEAKKDVTYATVGDTKLQLDLYSPKGLDHPVPAIVVIHGGGWMAGKRQDMASLAERLAEHGFVAATISYRFAPKHRFPAQIEDAKAAVRYLRANAKELNIDPNKIGATGGSAGGHMAMMLGLMDSADGMEGDGGNPEQPSKVQCVVNFVGPVNLVRESYTPAQTQILTAWVGGDPKEKQDAVKAGSPFTYISKGDAPMLCFFGTKDPLVSHDQAMVIADALTKAEVPGRVEMLLGAGHGWGGEEMERTIEATLEFFDEHLKDDK